MGANTRGDTLARDPLTGFGSRQAMMACLGAAVEPESEPSVFAVFGLDGLDEFEEAYGTSEANHLIASLAEEFARLVRPDGVCFAPRRREFCAHFELTFDAVSPILAAAAVSLRREGARAQVTTAFGYALLPRQAEDVVAALVLADRNLNDARKVQHRLRPISPPG